MRSAILRWFYRLRLSMALAVSDIPSHRGLCPIIAMHLAFLLNRNGYIVQILSGGLAIAMSAAPTVSFSLRAMQSLI